MNNIEIEELINQILWGKRIVRLNDGSLLCFRSPTIAEKNYANYIYKESLKKYQAESSLQSSDNLIQLARQNGEWTDIDDNYFYKFDDLVKVAYDHLKGASHVQKQRIEKQINVAEKKRNDICSKYNGITYHSVEQQAAEDKMMILIKSVTEYIDGRPLWICIEDFDHATDHQLLSELLSLYLKKDMDVDVKMIREIARSSAWRIRWNIGKENIESLFGTNIPDLNDIQFSLVYWSQVYDSVFMSMDCPPDEVINDDKRLDEWLQKRHEEDNVKKKNRMLDQSTKKRGFYDKQGKFHSQGKSPMDHKEVGIVIDGYYDENGYYVKYTPEEKRARAQEVYGGNAGSIRQILAGENKQLSKPGTQIKEEKLRRGRNRMLLNNFKGRGH